MRESQTIYMERRRTGDLEASSSHSEYGETRPLKLRHRIFISHSGRDKDFVRFLHDKLVDRLSDDGSVFFYEKSLPTAEPMSMENILPEARACDLGVLVLSEDFFTYTPNPMRELVTLTDNHVRLLPLFFNISVDEFKKKKCNNVWEDQWKEWLKGDEESLKAWKHALGFVDRFCGLEYCKLACNDLQFIHIVADEVALIVCPILPFSEKRVWGMDRLCKIVNGMYEQCASNRVSDGGTQVVSTSASAGCRKDGGKLYDLVGIYGFAGLGKSTLCWCLCDYYWAKFHGKVCYLDLKLVPDSSQAWAQTHPSENPFTLRMWQLLSRLITGPFDYTHLTFSEIQNLLRIWITKKPIFLAIDNISSDSNSLEEVDFYLSCNFVEGSKVFITARSEKILELVTKEATRFSTVIDHIPKLKFEEARGIFVQKFKPKNLQISDMEDEVKECVNMCVIRLQYYQTWYHPLMLKSLAASIRKDRWRTADLKLKLTEFIQLAPAIDKSDPRKGVFDLLDICYASLSEEAKEVFMDLSLFYKIIAGGSGWISSSFAWIRCLYSHVQTKDLETIFMNLEDLSFIDCRVVNYGHGCAEREIRMYDLMVDFSKYKAMGGQLCRIFISHSGRNENFVRQLHHELVNLYDDHGSVCFAEKSLPTEEPISMNNTLAKARGCELGVLVLSEDFFLHNPNPMLELETLMANEVRLLPLFYKISVDEFKTMRCYNVWEDQWKEWLKGNEERLRVWKRALSFVDLFSGFEYCKLASNDLELICKVVAQVAQIVRPNRPFSEEGVEGMNYLYCQ